MGRTLRWLLLVALAAMTLPAVAQATPEKLKKESLARKGAPLHGELDHKKAKKQAADRGVPAPGYAQGLPNTERPPACAAPGEPQVQVLYAHSGASALGSVRGALLSFLRRANYKLYTTAVDASGGTQGVDLRAACDVVGEYYAPNADYADIRARGQQAGFNRPNVKYLVFWDGNHPSFGGQGTLFWDDSPGAANLNNTQPSMYAVIYRNDPAGWGNWNKNTVVHELLHTMGAVQYPSAPHSTGSGHCFDSIDVMCYADTSDRGGNYNEGARACGAGWSPADCNEDDYFDIDPASGSYLATHWNVGGTNNSYLRRSAYQTPAGWSPWGHGGGGLAGTPDASSWGSGRLDMFVRGTDSGLHHRYYNGAWSGWSRLLGGAQVASNPGAVSWGHNRIDVFVRGFNDHLLHAWWDGIRWNGFEDLGGDFLGDPDVSSWGPNRLDVVVRGKGDQLWHKWFDGQWRAWEPLGGTITSSPTTTSWSPGRLDLFARGVDNAMWHKWYNGAWSDWQRLGGFVSADGPDATSRGVNRLDVFIRGGDDRLWQKWWDGEAWSPWERLDSGMTAGPGVTSWGPGRVDVFTRRSDNALWHKGFGN